MSGFIARDYSGRYYGLCHCENCRKRFRAYCGMELPESEDASDPAYARYEAFKEMCTAEQRRHMYDVIHEISDDIALNAVDYIRSESSTEIGKLLWIYSASGNGRLAKGIDPLRPCDNASVDYMGFRYRHVSVSPALTELRQWQCLANAGSVSFYIIGHLGNHGDTSTFEPTRKVFAFHKAHEALFANMSNEAEVVLLSHGNWKRNDPETYGWIRALTESHIPFDEIILDEFRQDRYLEGKKVVIVPGMQDISPEQAGIIDRFVYAGGTAIVSGVPSEGLASAGLEKLTEVRRDCRSSMFEIASEKDKAVFVRCRLTPYIAPGEVVAVGKWREDAQRYLDLIAEHPFGPPELCSFDRREEVPGVIAAPYGKGRCISVPFCVGSFYFKEGHANPLRFMQDVLFELAGVEDIAPELTPMVELTLKRSGNRRLLQFVNNSGIFSNSCVAPLPIYDLRVRLSGLEEKKSSTLNGGSATIEEKDGALSVHLDRLNDYECVVIEDR